MDNKIKVNLSYQKAVHLLYFSIASLSALLFLLVVLFLYKNFYQTITQSEEILFLKEKVAFETIDVDKFNAIIEKLDKKTKPEKSKATFNSLFK